MFFEKIFGLGCTHSGASVGTTSNGFEIKCTGKYGQNHIYVQLSALRSPENTYIDLTNVEDAPYYVRPCHGCPANTKSSF